MANKQLKIIYSLLKEINDENIPNASDYDISIEKYWELLNTMQDEGFIKGVSFSRGGMGNTIVMAFIDGATITIKGMEYLNNNSSLAKTYKGLKEIREWLPL